VNREQPARRDVERLIRDEIGLLLPERRQPGAWVAREDGLEELGLASLDVVQLAVSLAARLGVDPFQRSASITDVRTVGDLCQAYERALAGEAGEPLPTADLLAHQREVEARRTRSRGPA